jgi:hypothetical protein
MGNAGVDAETTLEGHRAVFIEVAQSMYLQLAPADKR